MRLLHGAVLPLAQEYLEDADASSDFLRGVNKFIMQTGPKRTGAAEKQGGIFEVSPEKAAGTCSRSCTEWENRINREITPDHSCLYR